MINKPVAPRKAGFTLLEVMIAVVILALTLSVLFGSQSQSLSLAAESKFNSTATFLTSLKLAELEAGISEPFSEEGEFGDEFPGYKWKMEVVDVSFLEFESFENIEESLQKVIITISWSDSPFTHSAEYLYFEKD